MYCQLLLVIAIILINRSIIVSGNDQPAPKLSQYSIDKTRIISVSGLSSGGYFAVQFHVAFSKTIKGAGIIAGGPYWCAEDNVSKALASCMKKPSQISVTQLETITYNTALSNTIDHPINLRDSRVYLFSGTQDSVVQQGVMMKLAEYYTHFIQNGNMLSKFDIPSEHAMVTNDYGNACNYLGTPFINNCNYSTAYNLLKQIYPDIYPPNGSTAIISNLMEFDQREFFVNLPAVVSMDVTGYVYVPSDCQHKKNCRLHIAFHGCRQGRMFVNNTFALHAGYNSVAETNNIIILYPQTTNSRFNPKGCWDWWGYTSPAYASQLGPQMVGVKLMMDRVVGISH